MRGLAAVFSLEIKALVRTKTFGMLLAAAVVWMLALPALVRSDGTAAGAHELTVRFSLGGVFLLTAVSLLASATGSLARERAARRLQLSLIRPISPSLIALGKIAAHVAVGAVVLAVACAMLACRADLGRPCHRVLSPQLPSVREEAKIMYGEYLRDPKTPEAVKRAKPGVVLRILENRALDHYQVIRTNEVASWKFDAADCRGAGSGLAVRLRFTNQYEMRQSVRGVFRLGGASAVVSNVTQSVLQIPLRGAGPAAGELTFSNGGESALMLRPRRDLALLVPADTFGANLLRSLAALVALLALVVSFGTFLSSCLGRPVALFVAFATLTVSEMSPSVLRQYPGELDAGRLDRIGLAITRTVAAAVRPVSAASPLEALSKDECVAGGTLLRLLLLNLLAAPCLLSVLSAAFMSRVTDDN